MKPMSEEEIKKAEELRDWVMSQEWLMPRRWVTKEELKDLYPGPKNWNSPTGSD